MNYIVRWKHHLLSPFIAHPHEDMQEIVTRFVIIAKVFVLQVNVKKMMFQPSSGPEDHHRSIYSLGEDLVTMKEFKYQFYCHLQHQTGHWTAMAEIQSISNCCASQK